jgi:hypothetical protein
MSVIVTCQILSLASRIDCHNIERFFPLHGPTPYPTTNLCHIAVSQPTGASSVAPSQASMYSAQSQSLPNALPESHFVSGSMAQSYVSGQTGGTPSVPGPGSMTKSYQSGQTGGAPPGPVPGSVSAGPTGQPQFPEITPFLANKYGETFKAANKDQAGDVPGGEVLRLLGSAPVDITVKKEAWDLVASASAQQVSMFVLWRSQYTAGHRFSRHYRNYVVASSRLRPGSDWCGDGTHIIHRIQTNSEIVMQVGRVH